jgi:hypothetical protein
VRAGHAHSLSENSWLSLKILDAIKPLITRATYGNVSGVGGGGGGAAGGADGGWSGGNENMSIQLGTPARNG